MKVCPLCHTSAYFDAAFCDHCGIQFRDCKTYHPCPLPVRNRRLMATGLTSIALLAIVTLVAPTYFLGDRASADSQADQPVLIGRAQAQTHYDYSHSHHHRHGRP